MKEFFSIVIWNNTLLDYGYFILAAIISLIVVKILGHFIVKYSHKLMEKTTEVESTCEFDEIFLKSIKKQLVPVLYIIAVYLCTNLLTINPSLSRLIDALTLAIAMILGAFFISALAIYVMSRYLNKKDCDQKNDVFLIWVSAVIKGVVWIIAFLLFLDNMGVEITALLAGAGIAGIAVAFAAQAILGDVFCFFSILSDRPFEIGDYLEVDKYCGTVEHIGLRTTRLRALSGEQLVFANTDLTNSRIQNYKTLQNRRIDFTLGVTYDTSYEKLQMIPGLIEEIINEVPCAQFYRAHFTKYGAFSLDIEIAYYIFSADYDTYLNIHQQINLLIKRRFDNEGIEFAYPTQTLYLPGMEAANAAKIKNV